MIGYYLLHFFSGESNLTIESSSIEVMIIGFASECDESLGFFYLPHQILISVWRSMRDHALASFVISAI